KTSTHAEQSADTGQRIGRGGSEPETSTNELLCGDDGQGRSASQATHACSQKVGNNVFRFPPGSRSPGSMRTSRAALFFFGSPGGLRPRAR
ncbi:hypothetical protein IscW_ISCW023420, partial [Ixodes scapularis]